MPKFERAIFLDRDGTLNLDTHYPHDPSELVLLDGVVSGMAELSALPVHIIIVSNQAGIALGRFSVEEMSQFNQELRRRIETAGGRIDAIYYCPDLEPKNLKGSQQPSACSKPAPGMLLEAARDYAIDLGRSLMVGDKKSDVMAGYSAGARTILIGPGKSDEMLPETPAPTWHVDSFAEAARRIVSTHKSDQG